jgi:tetrahydrodipicolinate N-succinyltransferase
MTLLMLKSDLGWSAVGQNRKTSVRANVFRVAPESRHRCMQEACPKRAMSSRTWKRKTGIRIAPPQRARLKAKIGEP